GGGVRLGEVAEVLEIGHDVAKAGRRELEAPALGQRSRADGLARRDVLENDLPQHVARAAVQLVAMDFEFLYHRGFSSTREGQGCQLLENEIASKSVKVNDGRA